MSVGRRPKPQPPFGAQTARGCLLWNISQKLFLSLSTYLLSTCHMVNKADTVPALVGAHHLPHPRTPSDWKPGVTLGAFLLFHPQLVIIRSITLPAPQSAGRGPAPGTGQAHRNI